MGTLIMSMTFRETNDYVLSHGFLNSDGQVVLKKPMKVFKKVYQPSGSISMHCIANLIIPEHAIVNLAQTNHRKLRSNKACCVSIFLLHDKQEIFNAYSGYNSSFKYMPGCVYEPTCGFATYTKECAPGIHFFAELKLALGY